jgi:hypothetical protein
VLLAQSEDGSWPYAVDGLDRFVDNFHTCFVLKNLLKVWRITGDEAVAAAITSGYAYYKRHLLDGDGQPRPFAETPRLVPYRRTLYDYAEGIALALLLDELDADAWAVGDRLTSALLSEWVVRDGHFATERLLVGWNRVPFHRWAQAQTFHALVRRLEAARPQAGD